MAQPSLSYRKNGFRVLAAIPCFNTEPYIADVVRRAKKHVDQVAIIDDGSIDATAMVARMAGAFVVGHEKNMGYGEAIKSCFRAAKIASADILVIVDGDGQHNPDEIPEVVAPILRGEAELTIGSRFLNNGVNVPRYRRFGINVITELFNFASKMKVSDAQSGFRAYSRSMFDTLALSEGGMSISIETLERARKRGTIIKEVPVSCRYLSSSFNLQAVKHGFGVALSVVKIRLKSIFT